MASLDAYQIPAPKDWQDFERLCRDLYSERWGDITAQINGRNGQGQCGVDIYGTNSFSGEREGVQCKGRDGTYGARLSDSHVVASRR